MGDGDADGAGLQANQVDDSGGSVATDVSEVGWTATFLKLVRRFWKWLLGLFIAALGAVIIANVQSGVTNVTHLVFDQGPKPPFTVDATLAPPPDLDFCAGAGVTSYVFLQPSDRIPVPTSTQLSSPDALQAWALASGGVPASGSMIRLTILGTSQQAVVIDALRLVVIKRQGPRSGAHVLFSGGCGGLAPIHFDANLDRDPPGPVTPEEGRSGPPSFGVLPAVPFPHQVSSSEPEELYLQLDTQKCTCDVYVLLDWKAPSAQGTLAIKADSLGNPLMIASTEHGHAVILDQSNHRWNP
jgi:hypothetical protein